MFSAFYWEICESGPCMKGIAWNGHWYAYSPKNWANDLGKKKRTIAQSLCGSLAAVDWHIFIDSQTIATLSWSPIDFNRTGTASTWTFCCALRKGLEKFVVLYTFRKRKAMPDIVQWTPMDLQKAGRSFWGSESILSLETSFTCSWLVRFPTGMNNNLRASPQFKALVVLTLLTKDL